MATGRRDPLGGVPLFLGYSACMGFFSGFALKCTGRALAVSVGLFFTCHQLRRYLQNAENELHGPPMPVDPPPRLLSDVFARATRALDADADGRVGLGDLFHHGRRLLLFIGAPAGACAAGGFLLGLRLG